MSLHLVHFLLHILIIFRYARVAMSKRPSRRKPCPHSKCKPNPNRKRTRKRTRKRSETSECQLSPRSDTLGSMRKQIKENIKILKRILETTNENPDNYEKTRVYVAMTYNQASWFKPPKCQLLTDTLLK